MKLPRLTVKRPITTMMVFMAVMLFGLYSVFTLPKDLLPEIELPALTIVTIYPGASAEDIESQVTNPLESVLAGTENLRQMRSNSAENVSFIFLEFDWGADITEAANSARDLMELVKRELPAEAMDPYIMKINSAMIPIVVYMIRAEESYAGIERIARDRIIDPVLRIDGVGSAFIVGQPTREIQVNTDPGKLKAYNVTIAQIAAILQAENISVPAGNIKFGRFDFALRMPGELESVDQLKNIAISGLGDRIIRLGDVAEIVDGFKEKDEVVYSSREKAVGLFIQKQTGTNTYEVFNAVDEKMQEILQTLPEDVSAEIVFDASEIIIEINNNLNNTIWFAAIFVIIIVFLFLREGKNSLIVILTIPFSMIVAYITMKLLDFTVNTFTLMAMIVAIGMVVDNAIVVLENINRHIQNGAKPKQAAIFGTAEMGNAITASTLTTISVFVPLIFIGGLVGILFQQLAVLVAVTMLASLITSLSLTPMMSSILLKAKPDVEKKKNKLFRLSERFFVKLENIYRSSLKAVLKLKFIVIFSALSVFVFTMYLGLGLGTDYIPDLDAGDVITSIEIDVGAGVKETERVAKMVEDIYFEEIPEMISQYTVIGQTETNIFTSIGFDEGKNKATISARLCLPQDRDRTAGEIAEVIRQRVALIPEVENFQVSGGSLMQNMLLGGFKPVEIKISGNDFEQINKTALEIAERFERQPGLTNIETSIDRGRHEYNIVVDKNKAYSMGLNSALIGMQVRQNIFGTDAGYFSEDGDQFKILVRYDEKFRTSVDDIKNIIITNMLGVRLKLSDIAEITETIAPREIHHEDQNRIVTVGANLDGISLSRGAEIAREIMNDTETPPEIILAIGGEIREQEEAFADLNLIFIIGLLLVYMIMASQFESFKDPFIILFAIPFSMTGVVAGFFVTGINLNMVTFVGVIMLLGIVVNNAIVLVDYTNLLRAREYNIFDAIIEAGASRLRPVLMTSFTTMLAMLPMTFSKGIGSELWVPLGITVISGLLISMLITLLLVPCIYAVINLKAFNKQIQLNNENDIYKL